VSLHVGKSLHAQPPALRVESCEVLADIGMSDHAPVMMTLR
jgi:exonuclease III